MATTLSTTLILQKTLSAYRTLFPFMGRMGTAFDDAPLRLNDTVNAHIRTLPTAQSYDGTSGYQANGNSARSLLTDVPITVDNHKHVPILFEHLNLIKDQKDVYEGAIGDAAYILGKAMVDSILAKVKSSNISYGETYTAANSDLDAISAITTKMNGNGAMPTGRVGLVSSAVASSLELDSRVASKDYYGALTGSSGLRVFRGVGGFEAIYEYPNLPTNNAATQTFTAATTDICTANGHGYKTGDRVRVTTSAADLPAGLEVDTTYYVIYLTANTFKLASSDANATAGTAVDITDAGSGTHSIVGYENVIGLFFSPESIAVRAGIPAQTSELAAALGIPQVMLMESLRDPISGFALALMKWQAAGTADLWISPTAIWGSAIGRQAGAAGSMTDKGALILRSA
jgi:hypothetical protein